MDGADALPPVIGSALLCLQRAKLGQGGKKEQQICTEIQPSWARQSNGGGFAHPILSGHGISGGITPSFRAAHIQYSWSCFSPSKGVIK